MANLRVDKITSTETFDKTGSVQFDGSGDSLVCADSADWDFGTGDFTIECFAYFNETTSVNSTMINRWTDIWTFQIVSSSQNFRFYAGASDNLATANNTIGPNIWYHFAASRSSGTLKLFINGVESASSSFTKSLSGSTPLNIGAENNTQSLPTNGHISNVRIVNGTALYTSNFKTPMRELEVVPGTVLLACQSKTDASLEKTGKTITVNGNAVASELTPGILTPIVKSGGGSAITGSVEFDGTGDYLSLAANSDFNFGSDNFTIEGFFYKGGATTLQTLLCSDKYYIAGNDGNWILRITSGTQIAFASYNGTGSEEYTEFSAKSDDGGWHHFAFVREGTGSNQSKFYFDGVHRGSMTVSKSLTDAGTNGLRIGEESDSGPGNNFMNGFLSNIRINKGTALYTADFIPPTRELKNVPGTVLLCCQDENSVTTESTGKTITSNGDPAPSNFTPQIGDDRQVTFEGVTKINTDAYFYLPTGDTASREATGTYNAGTRGIWAGGYDQPALNDTIDYITISSTGNALDFGNLTDARILPGALASSVRGIIGGGTDPSASNIIDYVTIPSTGNATDFGDLTVARRSMASFSNDVRGIWAGGDNPSRQTTIDYVTISSTGNAAAFGTLGEATNTLHGTSSSTRGLLMGGETGSVSPHNAISYVTISTTGSNKDFGDLTQARRGCSSCSSPIRALTGGGNTGSVTNTIDFVTIATTGNAFDFGNLTQARWLTAATSNSIRGVWGGGYNPSPAAEYDIIDYITIASTGNATDFGNLQTTKRSPGACSNGHGGLG